MDYRFSHFKTGQRVTCIIKNQGYYVHVADAKVSVEGDSVYICQNIARGTPAKNKLGYDYSWFYLDASGYSTPTVAGLIIIGVEGKIENQQGDVDMKEIKFGIKYDIGGDPIELFETRQEAEERITELLDKPSVDKSSIYLFEVGRSWKVVRPVSFELQSTAPKGKK